MLANRYIKLMRLTRVLEINKYNFNNCISINSKDRSRTRNKYSLYETLVNARPIVSSVVVQDKTNLRKTVSSQEVLEKLVAGLSTDIYQKNRVYKNDLMRVMSKVKEGNFCTKKQSLLLLRCCTQLLADEAPATRLDLAEQIWNTIRSHTELTVDHYNELLKVYIDNGKWLTVSSFVQEMSPIIPNITTYELMLRALGEAGDIDQATEVISNMKTQGIAATENVFNSLIIGQGKAGRIESVQEVLSVMKSLRLEYSADTYTAAARAYAAARQHDLVVSTLDAALASGIQLGETHVMEIVKTLAAVEGDSIIPKVLKYLPEETLRRPSISPVMQAAATQLVFAGRAGAALALYECLPLPAFGPRDDRGLHGRSLVRDCVKAGLPSGVIADVAEALMVSGRNPIAIQNAAEAALQLARGPLATDLLTHMARLDLPLRPHYFWPILLQAAKTHGEKGVMRALATMARMGVRADHETLATYALPHVSHAAPQSLVRKLQAAGVALGDAVTAVAAVLLHAGQVRAASEICEIFSAKVDAEVLVKALAAGYGGASDARHAVHLLEDVTEKARDPAQDWVGRFLCELVRQRRGFDVNKLTAVVEALESTKLRISSSAAEYCLSRVPRCPAPLPAALAAITDPARPDDVTLAHRVPHPRDMDEAGLESHLRELEAKGLNTRGVLRRLLQRHVRRADLPAARRVADKCRAEGVELSAGMRAAIVELHVRVGELDAAELALAELRRAAPNFTLDEHKLLDLAALAVRHHRLDDALRLLDDHARTRVVRGGAGVAGNCRRLLEAVAAAEGTGAADVRRALRTLTTGGYCRADTALLAPIVRAHLNRDDLAGAVRELASLAEQYNKTPLKHEVLCVLLTALGERAAARALGERAEGDAAGGAAGGGEGGLADLVRAVLDIDRRLHGAGAQISVLAALAEVGHASTLRRLLLDPTFTFPGAALARQCARWADERRARPLRTLADAARGLRRLDLAHLYELLMDVYQREDDVSAALELWRELQERDVPPSPRLSRTLRALCDANHAPPPPGLVRQTTAAS
ncbi:leucine-rich PPR motif-containing protein, mitochondrial [Aricia agestis]|uniref:leucine-rich PPR motif-containing protein, mitochondrial n=1 Tax=Aricia agestis TaxID=91739 RepID=UPI001C2016F7|nr:leucine-rich PPR motif-containing protein, mitochondrial [Aricia agestis]